jgi:CRP/FNR family transcriptional regulator
MKARVARALLHLAEHLGQKDGYGKISIEHKLYQDDLAAMAGVARENVSRTLGDWRRKNIITKKSAFGYMVDKAKLEHELVACN